MLILLTEFPIFHNYNENSRPCCSQCIIEYGIPYGIWRGVLLTIVTVAQTSIALPYALGWVEDFLVWAPRGKPNKHES